MPIAEKRDLRIHYEWTGLGDGPVLMLANAIGSNLHMWDKALPSFEKSYRVLRYDMRGHGESSVPPPPYSIEQLGSDLLFLLDSLSIERSNVCGLSLGGLVAMWIGIHAPERLSKVVLANTAARIGTRESWEERIKTVHASGMEAVALASPARWFTRLYREQNSDEMDRARAMIAATDAAGYAGCCAVLRDTDLTREINEIQAPCLVIAGAHDPSTPPTAGRAIQAALPDAKYVELDASHLSAWERAEDFAGAVLAFLGHSRFPEEERRYG